jgi:hypothetical protein
MADIEETEPLQVLHRLADGRAADVITVHQVALGGERIARRELALPDAPQQALADIVGALSARLRVNRTHYTSMMRQNGIEDNPAGR